MEPEFLATVYFGMFVPISEAHVCVCVFVRPCVMCFSWGVLGADEEFKY